MRRFPLAVAAACTLIVGATGLTATAAPSAHDAAAGERPGHFIVVLKDDASARTLAAAQAQRFGFDLGHVYSHALQGYSAAMPASAPRSSRTSPP